MFGAFAAGFGFGGGGGSFAASYRVYPVSFLDRPDAEAGDKLLLPPSALDRLASLHIEYPMLFKAENRAAGRHTHCGVLEFVADEGVAYMPYWMMQNLALGEGDIVSIASASLPKGTFAKLRPHTSDFLDVSNPRAVLERTLRGYSCLTKGDCICLHYNAKRFYIDVVEVRPGDAVSVIETDCEVDFAPPLDYVEPTRAPPPPPPAAAAPAAGPSDAAMADAGAPADAAAAPEEPAFVPFVGSGRRLDGKPAAAAPPPPPPPAPAAVPAAPAAPAAAPARPAGTVMFGGGNRLLARQQAAAAAAAGGSAPPKPPPPPAAAAPAKKEDDKEEEEPSFKAFTGKARSLRD